MAEYSLVFPHQIFQNKKKVGLTKKVLLLEDPLFFGDKTYPASFHKHKLILHRSTLKQYESQLNEEGHEVHYLEYKTLSKSSYTKFFKDYKIEKLHLIDPVDFIAEKRIRTACEANQIHLRFYPSPNFFLNQEEIAEDYGHKEHYAFTPFYIQQRKKLKILLSDSNKPAGGKWTYDVENRKKVPKGFQFPNLPLFKPSSFDQEAINYVNAHFANSPGNGKDFWYPTTKKDAEQNLSNFIDYRFNTFGPYQDAILSEELVLMHSMLSSSLNIGLLSPAEIVNQALNVRGIPLNSQEGFIRQVIGWREFVRVIYQLEGVKQRTTNYWKHKRKIPKAFYTGETGIEPIDQTIKKVLKYAYCHHIERLMVLGNFMLLCEIDPNEIYRWFMELFIDAYDWVMVPNVYGMSQYADGGLMTTKPYISSSNYILKMSNYQKGAWCEIWDGLFWRFLHKHQDFFLKQPRLGLLAQQLKKMDQKQVKHHLSVAEKFLESLE